MSGSFSSAQRVCLTQRAWSRAGGGLPGRGSAAAFRPASAAAARALSRSRFQAQRRALLIASLASAIRWNGSTHCRAWGALASVAFLNAAPRSMLTASSCGASGLAELVVERLQGGGVLALGGPHHPPGLVVVGDHGQVAVALAVADLVDADPQQPGQPAGVDLLGDDPVHDARRRSPTRSAAAG